MTDREQVEDRPERHRFELRVGDSIAIADYRRKGDVLVFTHTEVPAALQGRGIGGRLVGGALAIVRNRAETIVPRCPFVSAWLERHPEDRDLVAG